ncbi:MAG: sulfotransferase [Gammaproteobacteria bacterium HGW-Gammaproteobacteria-7]|nr:MAG: sulfotransferase [Gammaproteobacteria bacterium HGW-Gammaproteobacteria-7]
MSSPRIGFVIGGVQKCGTSALASYLREHPKLALPLHKEAHVFDSADFDERWSPDDIDQRYADLLPQTGADTLCGDATPIYIFHPTFIQRIARYNPAMRWVILLRDPAQRALSHYHMERARGVEHWPFWLALLLERWRLRAHQSDFSKRSPLRHFSYLTRGDYARQLDALYQHFAPEQVLVLRTIDLERESDITLKRVYAFLGVPVPDALPEPRQVFAGDYQRWARHSLPSRLLGRLFSAQLQSLRERHGIVLDQDDSNG